MEAVTQAEYEQVKSWLASKPAGLPEALRLILERLLNQYLWLLRGATRARDTLQMLRIAMGFIPKSERGRQLVAAATRVPLPGKEADDPVFADLRRKRDRAIRQKSYYEGRMRRCRQAKVSPTSLLAPSSELEQPVETVFTEAYGEARDAGRTERVERERDFVVKKGLHSTYDHVKRVNLEVIVTNIDVRVESLTDPETGRHVRANLDHIGPAGFQLTWKAIANLIKMVVGFAIPINRVAMMLGSKHFTPTKIYRAMEYAARMLLPIYLHLAEALGDAPLLSGDDSPTRVLYTADPPPRPPKATEKTNPPPIHKLLDAELGWTQPLASGHGEKTRLNVSLIMGKLDASDARSTVAFFRSHFGSVGNVLTKMLEHRKPSAGGVTIQGDLLPANMPSHEIRAKHQVSLVGCGAHARRPFWRYRADDEDLCYFMLNCFLSLSNVERMIDERGRTWDTTLKLRGKYGRWLWEAIRNRALAAMTGTPPTRTCMPAMHGLEPTRWPPDSKLYKACQYIVKNYDALTAYLRDPRLEFTNNRRERGLRAEKSMLVSSKFRKTRNGRAVMDILRTINATCTMARIDLTDYLVQVYAARHDLADHPHRHTPFALAKKTTNTANAQAGSGSSAVH